MTSPAVGDRGDDASTSRAAALPGTDGGGGVAGAVSGWCRVAIACGGCGGSLAAGEVGGTLWRRGDTEPCRGGATSRESAELELPSSISGGTMSRAPPAGGISTDPRADGGLEMPSELIGRC